MGTLPIWRGRACGGNEVDVCGIVFGSGATTCVAVVDEWSTLPIQQDGFRDVHHGAPAHACVIDTFDVEVVGSETVC